MDDVVLPDGQPLEQFMRGGVDLEARIIGSGYKVREESKRGYKQAWLDARLLLLSVCHKLLTAKSGVPGESNDERSHRILLLSAFIQGVPAAETLISEGQYIKAAAVLKQDYEIITRVREVRANAARVGQTPQVKHAPEGSQRFYGDLNKIAHPSNPDLIAELLNVQERGDAVGSDHTPTYYKPTADSMYELHVWIILEMTREAILLFGELYGFKEPFMAAAAMEFHAALLMLEEAGFRIE